MPSSIKQNLKLLESTIQKAEEFVAAGGDPKALAAAPVWMSLLSAFERVAEQFGYEIPTPMKKVIAIKADHRTI
jgi:hypothetical protein